MSCLSVCVEVGMAGRRSSRELLKVDVKLVKEWAERAIPRFQSGRRRVHVGIKLYLHLHVRRLSTTRFYAHSESQIIIL